MVGARRIALLGEVSPGPSPVRETPAARSSKWAFLAGGATVVALWVGFFCLDEEQATELADHGEREAAAATTPPRAAEDARTRFVSSAAASEDATEPAEGEAGASDAEEVAEEVDAAPPGRALEPGVALEAGDPVWAFSERKWYRAEIVRRVRQNRHVVHFLGYDERYDETIPDERLRLRDDNVPAADGGANTPGRPIEAGAVLANGDAVWAYSEGGWHRAEIVRRRSPGRYRVRFLGYGEEFDETLTTVSLRWRDD